MRLLSACLASLALLAPAAARAGCTVGKLAELPVTMVGDKATVPVQIEGRPARLAVDSGSFFSLLPAAVAADYRLRTYPAPFGLRVKGVNGDADVEMVEVKRFTLAGVDIPRIEFLVGGSAFGGLAGVLGQNVLHVSDVEYDFAGGALRMLRPHGCGRTNLAYWAAGKPFSVTPVFMVEGRTPQVSQVASEVVVNGVRLRAMFDTGAGATVLTLAGARRAGIDVKAPGVVSAGVSGGLGRKLLKTWIAPVREFQIGDERVSNTRLRVGELDLPDVDMLLGADFFLSHRVLISNSQATAYFTYNGGPVFDLTVRGGAPPAEPEGAGPEGAAPGAAPPTRLAVGDAAAAAPLDAEALARRGAAFAARGDYEHALADDTRAVEQAPGEPRYLRQRAELRLATRQPYLAMGDLDAALKLDPSDVQAHLLRARLRAGGRDRTGELADLNAASAAASKGANERLRLGQLYTAAFAYEKALAEYDAWIATHGQDENLEGALAGRGWTRDMLGRDLDKALADGERAVRLRPDAANARDARGTARLRRGEYDRAVADYDAALKAQPHDAWALYGRGVAETHMGRAAQGRTDVAAAVALNARVAEVGRRAGLVPAPEDAAPAAASAGAAPADAAPR